MTPVLQVQGLSKRYGARTLFDALDLELGAGEFVALVGESGVGKSTLLNCIAGLDEADAGRIVLGGIALAQADERERARLRREQLGFVFQAFHVLPYLSVAENVALPLLLQGRPEPARVQVMLEAVGLGALGAQRPAQLSGGELQRVAIARACVHAPRLILADEPTGNLDPASARRVLALLHAQVRRSGAACLLVTHSPLATRHADRVLRLSAHGLVEQGRPNADAGPGDPDDACDPGGPGDPGDAGDPGGSGEAVMAPSATRRHDPPAP